MLLGKLCKFNVQRVPERKGKRNFLNLRTVEDFGDEIDEVGRCTEGLKWEFLLVIVRNSDRIPAATHLLLRQRMLNGKAEVRDECRLVEQR